MKEFFSPHIRFCVRVAQIHVELKTFSLSRRMKNVVEKLPRYKLKWGALIMWPSVVVIC